MSDPMQRRFDDHMKSDERNFDRIAAALESLTAFHERMARLESDMDWLKRWYWLVVGAGVTGTISGIVGIALWFLKK